MQFGILGTLMVSAGANASITAHREQVILAMLLLHPEQDIPIPALVDAVWAAAPPASARGQVHDCVSRLRRRLATAGVPPRVITTGSAGYQATIAATELDSLRFDELVEQAREASRNRRPQEAHALYREALKLWRGPALTGIESNPVRQKATALDQRRLQVRLECAQTELELGMDGETTPELINLVEDLPYNESAHHTLMLALYRTGRMAEALDTYRRLRTRLRDDLGAEPDIELRQLHLQVLQRSPNLRTLRQAPPAAIETTPPQQLPHDVAAFTGRDEELRTLRALLPESGEAADTAIVLITGAAGVGKTALAIRFARKAADQFPGGQLYLNLRGLSAEPPLSTIDALAGMLRALGTPEALIPHGVADAASLYRSRLANRPVMVLLDNAASAEQVRELLPATTGSMTIVTSRKRLNSLIAHHGACTLTLSVLPSADGHALLTRLLGSARANASPHAVTELARACANLPLALRVAAANLTHPGRSISDYLDEMAEHGPLAMLALEDTEPVVQAAFDLSYRSVPAEAQRLFRLFGIAPGPDLTSDAAAAMAGSDRSRQLPHLQALCRAHLIDEYSRDRYTCHCLLRAYAKQRAEQEDSPTSRDQALRRLRMELLSRPVDQDFF
jgi:DNA-binding SARP family transcriptional activator